MYALRSNAMLLPVDQTTKDYSGNRSIHEQATFTTKSKCVCEEKVKCVKKMEELPYALMSYSGGSHGFPKNFEAIVKKNFQLLYLEEFSNNKNMYAPNIQALLVWWHLPVVDKELLDSLPSLKVIANSGAGVDHLDLKLITSYGITVINTPGVGDNATADMGMALMLASAKNVVEGNRISCSSDTKEFDFNWVGDDITEATLGIIGMGGIGYCIAQRAKGFRMKILYHNRNRRTVEEETEVGAKYCSNMADLLQQSDFVMVVVRLTPDTHNLIGREEFQLMKPTATLINISRGQVVDQDALVDALNRGVIKAAALDVTYPEPLPRNHPLLTAKNIILTPHIGNATYQTKRRICEKIVHGASDILKGLPVPDTVTAP
ncbi:glyoxylate/hydroxypyruvate reductase B-like [Bufo bufo]|uniref:glyoxylate/hydroxypyruvate reductase B-like n=1 Tax=Bufo bufo TaxID=8384 RepID=UPI001ABED5C5|nr:glyoxylate/hydroxypyruvate reductase B-like [Bufo bufo]